MGLSYCFFLNRLIVPAGKETAPAKEANGLFRGEVRAPRVSHHLKWVETDGFNKKKIIF